MPGGRTHRLGSIEEGSSGSSPETLRRPGNIGPYRREHIERNIRENTLEQGDGAVCVVVLQTLRSGQLPFAF